MSDFTVLQGPAHPLPIKYQDQGDGTAAQVVALAGGAVSASIAGFTPNGNVASLPVTEASAQKALPAGTTVLVTNTGSNKAYLKLSVGAGTAAVTDLCLQAGAAIGLTVGSNTFLNAIADTGLTTALRLAGGSGIVTGFGGGGTSAGGGGDASAANQTLSITSTDGINTKLTAVTGSKAPGTAAASSLLAGAVYTSAGVTLTNGQQAALQVTSAGKLLVEDTLGATAANQTSVIGTKAPGTAAASALLAGGVYNSTPPTLTNGQQCAFQFTSAGKLMTDATFTGGDASAANQTVVQGVIGAATAPTKMNVGGGVYNSTPITLTNGQSSALQLDANGYLKVNVASQTGVAQGSTSSGQTVSPIGVRTLSASPTDTTAQTNMPVADLKGSLIVQPYGLADNSISGCISSAMTGTTSTSLIAAPGSGLNNHITQITVSNSHATVGTDLELQDGSGGTTFYVIPAAAVYGGAAISFPKPLRQPTANTALYVKNTVTGASTRVSASGFKAP